jgi:hypothetical protein
LTDGTDQAVADVEGSIESPDDAGGAYTGNFEFPESDSVMQDILDGKTFGLNLEDGLQFKIRVNSASAGTRSGFSVAEFTSV